MANASEYHKAPAYRYYPDNFEQGTAAFSLAEVGAYQRLLNYQWSNGSVPGDSAKELALILRCTPSTARAVWKVISSKFVRDDSGQWRNARMEKERQKQDEFRAGQSQRGKASAVARRSNVGSTSAGSTEPQPSPNQEHSQPDVNLSFSSSSSLSDPSVPSKLDPTTTIPSERASSSPLVMSPIRFAKLQESHAFIGPRLRVPKVLHEELRAKLGGANADARLQQWYATLSEELDGSDEPIPDVFRWLRPRFEAWAEEAAYQAGLAKVRP